MKVFASIFTTVFTTASLLFAGVTAGSVRAAEVGSDQWQCDNFGIRCTNVQPVQSAQSVQSVQSFAAPESTVKSTVGSAEWECENFGLNCK